jgi:hypothetical protein
MPRNPGTGQYSKPIPDATPNTTIASAPYNSNVNDVVIDLNSPRPIVAGGTGATSAQGARQNIDAEVAGQQVTNFDSHAWENGSFWCDGTATAIPIPGRRFSGSYYEHGDPAYAIVLASDMDDPAARGYVRKKTGGVWGAWIQGPASQAELNDAYVNVAGDTMTGGLSFSLNGTLSSTSGYLLLQSLQTNLHLRSAPTGYVAISDTNAAPVRIADGGGLTTFGGGLTTFGGTVKVGSGLLDVFSAVGWPRTLNGCIHIGHTGSTSQYGIVTRPSTDGTWAIVFLNAAGVGVGTIATTTTTTAYNTSSDERLKENFETFDAGRIVDDTAVFSFNFKGRAGERTYGVSAQQANEVYPQAVTYNEKEDWWGIDYSKYVPVLLQELKTLRTRVAQLEAGLTAKPA